MTLYTPLEWKGAVPKRVTLYKFERLFGCDPKTVAPHYTDDVIDAIMIAEFWLARHYPLTGATKGRRAPSRAAGKRPENMVPLCRLEKDMILTAKFAIQRGGIPSPVFVTLAQNAFKIARHAKSTPDRQAPTSRTALSS